MGNYIQRCSENDVDSFLEKLSESSFVSTSDFCRLTGQKVFSIGPSKPDPGISPALWAILSQLDYEGNENIFYRD